MQLNIRKSDERGATKIGWLDSKHSFSFGSYHDPQFPGFKSLRVINEDKVAPSGGFPTHPHSNMEIISYVVSGELEHKDSLGTGSVIRPGEIQRMSAGSGIRHSEFNPSSTSPTHFLQIWVEPKEINTPPSYEQKRIDTDKTRNSLHRIASPQGGENEISILQDIEIYRSDLDEGNSINIDFGQPEFYWVQVVSGGLGLSSADSVEQLQSGDGVALANAQSVSLTASKNAEVLVFRFLRA